MYYNRNDLAICTTVLLTNFKATFGEIMEPIIKRTKALMFHLQLDCHFYGHFSLAKVFFLGGIFAKYLFLSWFQKAGVGGEREVRHWGTQKLCYHAFSQHSAQDDSPFYLLIPSLFAFIISRRLAEWTGTKTAERRGDGVSFWVLKNNGFLSYQTT